MVAAGATAGAALLAGCALPGQSASAPASAGAAEAATATLEQAIGELPAALAAAEPTASAATDELGDDLNSFEQITNYNNYYEFTYDKEDVAKLAADFATYPWQVEVTGMVNKPRTFTIEELIGQFTQQERIYRLRCVEAWSMVIPWVGFPMHELLAAVEPTADAKFVKFTSVMRPEEMPGQQTRTLDWPYVEGLRLDEAMNDLAIFATGMYGKLLTPQQGAPVRMVVPWKYGFKGGKAINRRRSTASS
jgi:sulfoxide reductase catalytic subunit YedY